MLSKNTRIRRGQSCREGQQGRRDNTEGRRKQDEQGTIQPCYFESSYQMQLQVGRRAWIWICEKKATPSKKRAIDNLTAIFTSNHGFSNSCRSRRTQEPTASSD